MYDKMTNLNDLLHAAIRAAYCRVEQRPQIRQRMDGMPTTYGPNAERTECRSLYMLAACHVFNNYRVMPKIHYTRFPVSSL